MANWFKDEIEHFGDTVDRSIQKASAEIHVHIDSLGSEINKQRSMTRADVEMLIDYAAHRFGSVIDEKVSSARAEIGVLVTEKLAELRGELSAAATEQKRTAVRNASVAVGSAVFIGLLSLAYKKMLHGEIDLFTVFRSVLAAAAAGHLVWLVQRNLSKYFLMNRTQKSVFVVGAQYLGVFTPKGAMGHLALLVALLTGWAALSFWPQIRAAILAIA